MSYYKSNNPDVISALKGYLDEYKELQAQACAFKDGMGAETALTETSVDKTRFAGLTFKPEKDHRFWTKPDRNNKTQRPRDKVTGITQEEKAGHAILLKTWNSMFPTKIASKDKFYESIGSNWGNFWLSGISWFMHKETIYMHTNCPLNDHATEILGSEFKAAELEYKSEKQAAA